MRLVSFATAVVRTTALSGLPALAGVTALLGITGLVGVTALVGSAAGERPGVAPDTPWSCPAGHPIKGYVSAESGRRVYYLPGSRFYEEASPERCYASEEEALGDGSRPARESLPPARLPGVVRTGGAPAAV